jgi:GMP synthase (glutamine-hydrolysing)
MQRPRPIVVLDFGSQYTQLIARRIREMHVYAVIVPCNLPFDELAGMNPQAVILSGGPSSVYDAASPTCDDRIFKLSVPILGICRGLQLTNVNFGGSLVPDLEEAGYRLHRCETLDCRHDIVVERNSGLFTATGRTEGNVNSSHHQGVDRPAAGLRIVARSDDGIVEAMEWNSSSSLPFFQLVQYHPERMQDFENPLSKKLLERFLQSITFVIEQL